MKRLHDLPGMTGDVLAALAGVLIATAIMMLVLLGLSFLIGQL